MAAAVDQSVIDNAMTSGVDVFAHVWVQALGHFEQLLW